MSASTLLDILHLRDTCPPEIWTNQCSLWFGTAPISPERPVQVSNGHAYRLVISRGIWDERCQLDGRRRCAVEANFTTGSPM